MNTRKTQRSNSPLQRPLPFDGSRTSVLFPMLNSETPDSSSQSSTTGIALFAPISASVLQSVDPTLGACFLKERERYELEITAKPAEAPTMALVPYTASIDRSLLKSLFYMGKFDEIAPNAEDAGSLTSDNIKQYVDSLVKRCSSGINDPSIIEKALESFSMPTHITEADARVTLYCADFFECLESIGYGTFRDDNPKKAVSILVQRLQPAALKREMRRRISYDESLEKNLKKFISVLTKEAVNRQIYDVEIKDSKRTATPKNAVAKDLPTRAKGPRRPSDPTNQTPLCLGNNTASAASITTYETAESAQRT